MADSFSVSSPARAINCSLMIPGDKSISHRAIILSAIAQGRSTIDDFLRSDDCLHTIAAFQAMGVPIDDCGTSLHITGVGLHGLCASHKPIDVGNSGTCMRLLLGVLAAQPFESTIAGDASIALRPMQRVTDPLAQMGSRFEHESKGRFIPVESGQKTLAPIRVLPVPTLSGITYTLPIASAQVKSAILLAGLFAQSPTTVIEPIKSRDHTEIMLRGYGADIQRKGHAITLNPGKVLQSTNLSVPRDISSAAFFLVAGAILNQATIRLPRIGLNPTRTGIIHVLQQMRANITIENEQLVCGERIGDLIIQSSQLTATDISGDMLPLLIDEIPILAVAAAFAKGTTRIADAQELRVKESDRITTIVTELRKFGVDIEETPDGMLIHGQLRERYHAATVTSYGDHRIAMSAAIMGMAIENSTTTILDTACIQTSFPEFTNLISEIMSKRHV